jgi:hypothetical protein
MDDLPEPVNEETMVAPDVPAAIEEDVASPVPEPAAAMPEPESSAPNALTTFMAEWNAKLQAKIGAEQDAEKADRAKAKEELDQWKKQVRSSAGDPDVYAHITLALTPQPFPQQRDIRLKSKNEMNRSTESVFVEQIEAALESKNEWERVTKLVDITQDDGKDGLKSDVGRMRSLFLQLKNKPIESK